MHEFLRIIPTKDVDKKATSKGSISNKYIGYGTEGVKSSTSEYAKQVGDKANTGTYDNTDTVFVSVPGRRGNVNARTLAQNKTIAEALKALKAGATLVTDNADYVVHSNYNEGEKRLAEALNKEGAIYSERIIDGYTIGIWNLPNSNM